LQTQETMTMTISRIVLVIRKERGGYSRKNWGGVRDSFIWIKIPRNVELFFYPIHRGNVLPCRKRTLKNPRTPHAGLCVRRYVFFTEEGSKTPQDVLWTRRYSSATIIYST
jgi:hypothetical protein